MAIGAAVAVKAEPINVRASLCARFARIHAAGTPEGWSMRPVLTSWFCFWSRLMKPAQGLSVRSVEDANWFGVGE
jgi:hypothetical protein